MSIFVTGDVHGVAEYGASRFSSRVWPLGRTLTRDDVVIVAGDFGFIWSGSNTDKYWLDWFESKPWTTCFVDGNHENHHLLAGLPMREWNGGPRSRGSPARAAPDARRGVRHHGDHGARHGWRREP